MNLNTNSNSKPVRVYRRLLPTILILLMVTACRQGREMPQPADSEKEGKILVAENIIYDVVIKPEREDDEWEAERLAGYRGEEMVSALFEAIYSGSADATDYFTGEKIKLSRLKKLEETGEYHRSDIAKLQFTENWYFNLVTLEIEKDVISIVPGYRYTAEMGDVPATGYRALFSITLR